MKQLKKLLLSMAVLIAIPAMSQTIETVEVPKNHKIVFIPWFVPTSELTWTWHPAKNPKPFSGVDGDRSHEWDGVCSNELVFSPSLPDADCVCEDQLVVSPATSPAWCEGYPY